MTSSMGKGLLRGSMLSYGSFIISKGLVYLSTLALARLLAPRDFGLVGYALLSISLLDVMKDLGVTTALTYRQDVGDDEAGDAFTLNVASGLAFCVLCWLLGPLAAAFFHDPRVTTLTRALGLSFILYGLGGVHGALLQKRLRFGRGFLPDLVQGAVKGAVSIGLALHGLGYWSLVWGHLAGVAAMTGANWLLLPWRPRLGLHRASTRRLLGYGLQITLISVLGVIIYNGDYLIVGRVLGSAALGLYTLAYSIPQMLTLSLSIALSRVFFPAYAAIQGDRAGLRQGYLTVLRYSALVLAPLGLGLYVAAPAFVHALYRPAWWATVPALQALALYATIYAVGWNAGDIYKATGRPDIQWKLDIVHLAVLLPALLVGALHGGFVGVALAQVAVAIPYSVARFWLIRRILDLDMATIVGALRVAALAGLALLGSSALASLVAGGRAAPLMTLALQGVAGSLAYGGVALGLDPRLRRRFWRAAGVRAGYREDGVLNPPAEGAPIPSPVFPSAFDRPRPYDAGTPHAAGDGRGVGLPAGRRQHDNEDIHEHPGDTYAHRHQEAAS